MSMVHCYECNKPISSHARKCPHCGFNNGTPGLAVWHLAAALLITTVPTGAMILWTTYNLGNLLGFIAVLVSITINYGVARLLALVFPRTEDRNRYIPEHI